MVDYIGRTYRQTLKIGDNVSGFAFSLFQFIQCFYRTGSKFSEIDILHEEIEFRFNPTLPTPSIQLERTPLHYAMGVNGVEAISRILVKNGAKRVAKDLKGRQPSYYFMNKADILRLQEEEDR